ncbi:hypothetical protein [Thiomonas intermedia]|uniref:hypothetical protein n=1 Tax=Thiomonas intermedia TaxID=926 RepID=UPI001FE5B674|nr:hypothetical protein [Thiomonas intermedia]
MPRDATYDARHVIEPSGGFVPQEPKHGPRFWLGNGLLALAAVFLLFLDQAAQWLGTGAVAIWMGLVAIGVYFIVRDGGRP